MQLRLERVQEGPALGTLRRILAILKTVVAQIDVLETMTPREFHGFRARLGVASGFQSAQFRELEAVLGRRDPAALERYPAGDPARARIERAMARPSVYDSFLRYLDAAGYDVPRHVLGRDTSLAQVPEPAVQALLLRVYADDGRPVQVAERLVDVDEGLQEWRYRHVKMVERTIGGRPGTGGSSGAAYLRGTLFAPVFEDLWAVRSAL